MKWQKKMIIKDNRFSRKSLKKVFTEKPYFCGTKSFMNDALFATLLEINVFFIDKKTILYRSISTKRF
jgi:hypothetical protein